MRERERRRKIILVLLVVALMIVITLFSFSDLRFSPTSSANDENNKSSKVIDGVKSVENEDLSTIDDGEYPSNGEIEGILRGSGGVRRLSCPYDVDGNGVVNPGDRGFISANLGACYACENNIIEFNYGERWGEQCECGNDGVCGTNDDDLQGYSCQSLELGNGQLRCYPPSAISFNGQFNLGCTLDTRGCSISGGVENLCGNGELNPGEICDPAGGETFLQGCAIGGYN